MLREISRDLPAEPIGRDRIPYDVEAQFMPLEGFDKARLSQIAGRRGGQVGRGPSQATRARGREMCENVEFLSCDALQVSFNRDCDAAVPQVSRNFTSRKPVAKIAK